MAKKTTNTAKEPVKLREKKLANGNLSLYLDIYRNGRREYEFLKLYLIPAQTASEKEQNRQTLATAQAIRAKRQIELQNGEHDFTRQFAVDTPFLEYYRKLCEDRHKTPGSNGNWGNWWSCLKHLEQYCDEYTTFREITPEWIQGFKDYLEHATKDSFKRKQKEEAEKELAKKQKRKPEKLAPPEPLSQNSKVSYFNKLRACINQAFDDRIIPFNPLRGIEGFKEEEVERGYLTIEELKLLAATECEYPILKRTFMFSCLTGLRKSDITKLTWGEVHKMGDFTRIIFKQKKTKGQEYLDITPMAEEYMGNRGNNDDLVFEGFFYSSWVSLELKRWLKAAGIDKENITFHCGRHTFAVMMLDLGNDIYTVSKLLGHRFLQTTQIYAKVLDKNKQEAIKKIPSLK